MNERIPDSSGLPLRAMVMVLLFLGVIFLLLGWQAMNSGGSADDDSSRAAAVTTTTTRPSPPATPAARQAAVRVYNISGQDGVAGRTANELKAAGFNVTDIGNLSLPDVSVTTVYFTNADSERATAEAVGQRLGAAVEPRIPEVADQPPGVIVVVAR
ncbi:MAG: LytR C-terminal domain-containing protein [Mycobacterium sp.]|uniref:LytR C-terminal domain-containing protein n=1 Tax=Mycobacterium sp. TaxID=1785 RepID=UPI00262FB5E2|nr:LytR C-terminal domain-containing protein [Mycobacterium sp.]MDI3312883.1 LytR C-terminal domain-containing protein [Mycobacterium sp.]